MHRYVRGYEQKLVHRYVREHEQTLHADFTTDHWQGRIDFSLDNSAPNYFSICRAR